MKVLLKKVGQPYNFVDIEGTVTTMEQLLDGPINTIDLHKELAAVFNVKLNNGKNTPNAVIKTLRGLETIQGDFLICYQHGGSLEDLPDNMDLAYLINSFHMIDYDKIMRKR